MAEVLRVLEVISKQIIELEARVVEIEMMMRDGQRFRMGFLEGLATAEFSDEESSSEESFQSPVRDVGARRRHGPVTRSRRHAASETGASV